MIKEDAVVIDVNGKEVELPPRNDAFYNFMWEDKSNYPKASETTNRFTGFNYVDNDDDFLIGASGGFLFNMNFVFRRTFRFKPAANIFDKYKNRYIPYKRNSFKYDEWRKREERRRYRGYKARCKLYYEDIDKYDRLMQEGKPDEADKLLHEVSITGEHYNFINYGRIHKLKRETVDKKSISAEKGEGFPQFFDSQYWYYKSKLFAKNNGFHIIVGKSRRGGFSYMEGIGSANVVNLFPGITVIHGAYDKKYITKANALTPMARTQINFYEESTPFNRCPIGASLLKDSEEETRLGYRGKDKKSKGYKSILSSISFLNNPSAAIGKDAKEIKLEELSDFSNFDEMMGVTEPTIRTGSFTTGLIIGFGTGGSREGNWVVFERNFYKPMGHNFMPFENVWDENKRHTTCGFYKPYWWGLEGMYGGEWAVDEDGNSNYKVAMNISEMERANKYVEVGGYNSKFVIYCSQYSNFPAESFSRGKDNIFNSVALSDRIAQLKSDADARVVIDGQFVRNDSGHAVFKTNKQIEQEGDKVHEYIDEVPFNSSKDTAGCTRIYHYPKRVEGKIPNGIYYITDDSVGVEKDKDEITDKHSLHSFKVWLAPNGILGSSGDIPVASYIGRRDTFEEDNRIVLLASEFYNAKVLPEVNRGTIVQDFRRWGELNRLLKEPLISTDNNVQIKQSNSYGSSIGNSDKKLRLIRMLKDVIYEKKGVDQNGKQLYTLHYIDDLEFLEELRLYTLNANFDRVSDALLYPLVRKYKLFNIEDEQPSKEGEPTLNEQLDDIL